MSHWITPAALSWLERLLQDRFGHPLRLHAPDFRTVRLGLNEDPAHISFEVGESPFTRADSSLPCAQWDAAQEGWLPALPDPLPAPGSHALPAPLIAPTTCGWHIRYDILGLAYWMLTRQEEVGRTDLDAHGRFPATSSHALRHGYLQRPIVDEWFHLLGQVIQRLWPALPLKEPSFSVRVSHDVDAPSRYAFSTAQGFARALAGDLLKRRAYKSALQAPWIRLKSKQALHPGDPYNTFDWIMATSEHHGLKSAFYFIGGHTDPRDADYTLDHPAIRHLMRHIHARGHEIGLHPSYGSYQTPKMIADEARQLRRIAREEGIEQGEWGGRMHYLRWEQPTTLRAWAEAGMDYDSTLSYADRPGFRCGTCHEYPAFDPVTRQSLPLRVRPLIAMECTIMAERYMGLGTGDAALAVFSSLRDACRAVRGCFTLLWHNTQFETRAERELYRAILASCPTGSASASA